MSFYLLFKRDHQVHSSKVQWVSVSESGGHCYKSSVSFGSQQQALIT